MTRGLLKSILILSYFKTFLEEWILRNRPFLRQPDYFEEETQSFVVNLAHHRQFLFPPSHYQPRIHHKLPKVMSQ